MADYASQVGVSLDKKEIAEHTKNGSFFFMQDWMGRN